MILKSQYYGNYTYCGTYALYDLMQSNIKISMNKFEILTSVPFGISHNSEYLHRILSPYVDPTNGLDKATKILNIDLKCYQSSDKDATYYKIKEYLKKGSVVLGPVDMSKLSYLPKPEIYNKVPHYITLYKYKNNKFFLNDSEGLIGYHIPEDKLMDMCNSEEMYETKESYNLRIVSKYGEIPNKELLINISIANAKNNFISAYKKKQGPYAFLKLWDMLKDTESKYYNFLFYDLEILIQRKHLLLELLQWGEEYIKSASKEKIELIVIKQMDLISNINSIIRHKEKLEKENFKQLYILEKELTMLFYKNIMKSEV